MAEWSKAPDSRHSLAPSIGSAKENSGPRMRAWVQIPLLVSPSVFLDKLVVGNTYMLEGLQVKAIHGDPKWNKTGHNYELTWGQNTVAMGPCIDRPGSE